ncbi:hypothetical protein [Sinorhizobium fredii]|uniref:hypothetical protein n=1 Tax=Rhizobium fredii TaxID=380 RepID=UPI00210E2A92|nr:hypothetical protein [Sinorhizobium fredii]
MTAPHIVSDRREFARPVIAAPRNDAHAGGLDMIGQPLNRFWNNPHRNNVEKLSLSSDAWGSALTALRDRAGPTGSASAALAALPSGAVEEVLCI